MAWKKVLYIKQPYPDNYVDETFLEEMKKNLYLRVYDFKHLAAQSGIVTQQFSCVCLFVAIYFYMKLELISAELVLLTSFIFSILCSIVYLCIRAPSVALLKCSTVKDITFGFLFLTVSSLLLSPVLVTLTESISTDTIYAMTVAMLSINLFLHDYKDEASLASDPVAINAAFFSAVCLASRLHTVLHAFTTVLLAVGIFALWPVVRRIIKIHLSYGNIALTIIMGTASFLALLGLSSAAAVAFIVTHFFINFVCPLWLLHLQPYKENIYGPWDEAKIQ